MTIEVINWAFNQPIQNSAKKFVLIALADNTDDHGICFPSYNHLERKTSLSRSTIIRHMNDLVSDGYIQKSTRYRKNGSTSSNVYRFTCIETDLQDHPFSDCFPIAEGGSTVTPPPCHSDTLGYQSDTPHKHQLTEKEKKELTLTDFIIQVEGGLTSSAFEMFKLTEDEIKAHAYAAFDHWAGTNTFPKGDAIAYFRNYMRKAITEAKLNNLVRKNKDRKGDAVEVIDSNWALKVKKYKESGFWHSSWGEAPDNEKTVVPAEVLREFNINHNQKESEYA